MDRRYSTHLARHAPDSEAERRRILALSERGDEAMATCIHCKTDWYVIHYRDGVCHTCQKKRLPGRSVLLARERRSRRIRFWLVNVPICVGVAYLIAHVLC